MDTEQTAPPEILQETVVISDNEVELEVISRNLATFSFEDYEDHIFRLVLSYPLNREFLNRVDLAEKINEFSSLVLKIEQYALLFRVNCVAIAQLTDYYLISFPGSFSGKYLEVEITELVMLLTTLLESYFTCVQQNEFLPLHFEVDGQTIITPIFKSYGVPEAYDFSVSFKDFIANEAIWNIADLSGSIIIETVTSEIAVNVCEGIATSVWESSQSLLEAGSEVTSEIVTVGSEVGTEVLTGVAEATAGIFELLLEFLVELLAGLLI